MTEPNPSLSLMKILRVGTMIRQVLEEQNTSTMDEEALVSLREVYRSTVEELEAALPAELVGELGRLSLPFDTEDDELSEAELRIANAQLLGWLDGLTQGFQLMLMAQSAQAQQNLSSIRGNGGTPPIEGLAKDGQYL